MGIRIEQIDINSINKVFLMKDEVKEFISKVQDSEAKVEELKTQINTTIEEKLETKADKDTLSRVATTGNYNDLINIPEGLINMADKVVQDNQESSPNVIWSSDKIVNYINENVGTEVTETINDLTNKLNQTNDNVTSVTNTANTLSSELVDMQNTIQTLATQSELERLELDMQNTIQTLATQSELDRIELDIQNKVQTLASQSEIERLELDMQNKVNKNDLDDINNALSTKVEFLTFNELKDEVAQARRGKMTLLKKIIEIDTKLDKITTVSADATVDLPVGSIIWFFGTEAPNTFAICDGHEIDRNTYYDLFQVIKTTFGEGDGSTTFNVPDLMSESLFIRSSGSKIAVGEKQVKGMTDVRQSYEGTYNTDKLYIVGGKSFNKALDGVTLEPASMSLLPCIKIQEDKNPIGDPPIGMLNWFASELPNEYLNCDGRAVSRTEYADLFRIIGTKYGEGDGTTTFNLPNLASRNLFVKSAANTTQIGNVADSTLVLTDIRNAYEGDQATDKFYPVGGNSFINEHNQSEVVPPCLALNAGIKVKSIIDENDRVPMGTVTWYSNSSRPAGYVICDGSELSRFDYPQLFEAIGTRFGNGDGVSTFNVPNLIHKNKFIRAAGNEIIAGTETVMELVDVREAYEGDHNITGLYPLGAKYFTNDAIYEDVHPNNIAFLPCMKALNIKNIDTTKLVSNLVAMPEPASLVSTSMLATSLATVEVPKTKNLLKNVSLKDSKASLTITNKTLKFTEIKSCFINVLDTDQGAEYICDVNANAAITKDGVVVYLKGLDEKVSNAKITLNIQVIGD